MSLLGKPTSERQPIVILDCTKDRTTALIAGRSPGESYDSYFYVPMEDMKALRVHIPSDAALLDDAPASVHLKQMHYLARLVKGQSIGAKDWENAWHVAGYFKSLGWI